MAFETPSEHLGWCYATLPTVSRTFALNIRTLPPPLRRSVTLAYLLFRLADTIEDVADLSAEARSVLFAELTARLTAPDPAAPPTPEQAAARQALLACRPTEGEAALVRDQHRLWAAYAALPGVPRGVLARWLAESVAGMISAPAGFTDGPVKCLETPADLRRYCWYVAGTVGMLLTELFVDHSPGAAARAEALTADAEAFGRALQLTNILQDVAADHADGRCYLPRRWLESAGVPPARLLEPDHRAGGLSVIRRIAAGALADLRAALRYTLTLPAGEWRLRVFCLWPLLAALRTLGLIVRGDRVLTAGRRPKITRRRLYQDMAAAVVLAPFDGLLTRYFEGIVRADFPAGRRQSLMIFHASDPDIYHGNAGDGPIRLRPLQG